MLFYWRVDIIRGETAVNVMVENCELRIVWRSEMIGNVLGICLGSPAVPQVDGD